MAIKSNLLLFTIIIMVPLIDFSLCDDFQQNRTVQRASVFSQRVITPWNALPEKCVNSDSINKFKSSLNDAWKEHPEKFSCV